MSQDDWGIVVGINRYPGLKTPLKGSVNDAIAFHEWLVAPTGGDVPTVQVARILSSDFVPAALPFDEDPTPERVERAFLKWKSESDKRLATHGARLGRRLYVFVAGHGFEPESSLRVGVALLAANARKDAPGLHIAVRLWAQFFLDVGIFDEAVVFMDCCREQYPLCKLREPPLVVLNALVPPGKYLFGYAAASTGATREHEVVTDDGTRLWRGTFSQALLDGLRGRAADRAGQITARSLALWLESHWKNYFDAADLAELTAADEPQMVPGPKASDDFVVAVVPAQKWPVTLSAPPGTDVKVRDGWDGFKVVLQTKANGTPIVATLPTGAYTVFGNNGEVSFELPSKRSDGGFDVGL